MSTIVQGATLGCEGDLRQAAYAVALMCACADEAGPLRKTGSIATEARFQPN